MGQPTQRATNYTARSNIYTAQVFIHANGQRPKRAPIRQRSRRRQRRGEPHTEHGLVPIRILPPQVLENAAARVLPSVFVGTDAHIEHHRKLTKNYGAWLDIYT